ncbi:MAG: hypothetical protein HYZ23_05270, partial [Chloroflexi bacterium]|nr:hypothetical protein [Chloroflexota bacterium]
WVETQASPTCPNGPKRVFFQPILFQPTDSGLGFGFINVTIGSYTAFRVPRGQQVNHPTGTYTTDDRWAIPLPELQTMQPGESLRVEIQGNATKAADNTIVFVLGQEAASHSYETLTSADAKNTTWKIFTPYMTVGYKIWMEDWQWGGAISNPQMPAPTNLKLGSYVNAHELTWDYDPDAKNKFAVDGFIVYPKYSCGNSSQPTQPPLVASAQKLSVATKTMPAGCICSYQVSAFGASGESALSASTTEACQTPAAEESVLVTFESVKVNSLAQPTSASITLSANGRVITSPNLLLEAGNINSLKNVAFTGASTANQVTLNFAAGESRAIQLGFSAANLCIGQALVGKDMKTWSGAPASYIMTSTDGNCTVIVSINGTSVPGAPPVLPPANLPPVNPPNNPPNNPPVNPPNNPPVNPPAGNGTTRFINNTSHPIVSLVIDSQDVIQTQAQIILQGSWLDVSGVTANNHTLEAANGFMDASGSLQLLLRLPAETFAGAPGSFTINDPGIEQLLTGAFIGEYWDANTIIHSAGFCFHANGSFDFFDDGKFQSSGSYSLISRNPGAYSVKFNVKDSQGEQFAGDYSYAGPQMGLMLIHNGPPSWPMIEYIRDTQCPAKP